MYHHLSVIAILQSSRYESVHYFDWRTVSCNRLFGTGILAYFIVQKPPHRNARNATGRSYSESTQGLGN